MDQRLRRQVSITVMRKYSFALMKMNQRRSTQHVVAVRTDDEWH